MATGEDDEEQRRELADAAAALDRMTDVVDSFETYVIYAASREEHGTQYRLNLLWIHAFAALLIAPLMSATGRDGMSGPSFVVVRQIPGTPYSLSALLGIGGVILGLGCVFRAKRVEVVGLCLLMIFYLTLAVSFAALPIMWLGDRTSVKPPMYAPVVYCHLAVIMSVHMWALVVRRRDERTAKAAYAGARADQAARRDDGDDGRGGAT